MKQWLPGVMAGVCVLALNACAISPVEPLPLPGAADTRAGFVQLKIDPATLKLDPLKAVTVNPQDGLDPLEIAVLAVFNDPDLAAKRVALGVTSAQIFAAGLLPNPQFDIGFDQPVSGPDNKTAFSLSPSIDLVAYRARTLSREAAQATGRQADLDLLWAEWGVAGQARGLAENALAQEARAVVLRRALTAATDRYDQSSRSRDAGDVTSQTAAAALATRLDIQAQLNGAIHDAEKARRDLAALLNLEPTAVLPLVRGAEAAPMDAVALDKAISDLPARRPDLLALQAGYQAQDATLRRTVLASFPLTQVAAALARDTAGVVTLGAAAAFALPILNNGQGEVRIQTATREQLRAEYQARLDQTKAEAQNAAAELFSSLAQAASLETDVPRLEALAQPAEAAFARRDIDSETYLALTNEALARRADLDQARLAARLARIELETLLFLPPATSRAAR